MSPELETLARRAVACKGWRWMPGMLAHHPNWRAGRVSHVGLTAVRVACRYPSPMGGTEWAVPPLPITDLLPDLNDPGTLGCMLSLVREAWRNPKGSVYYLAPVETEPGWFAEFGARAELYATEAEALVVALEAAP